MPGVQRHPLQIPHHFPAAGFFPLPVNKVHQQADRYTDCSHNRGNIGTGQGKQQEYRKIEVIARLYHSLELLVQKARTSYTDKFTNYSIAFCPL